MNDDTITWNWRAFDALIAQEVYDILALRQSIFIIEQQCIYPDIDYKDKQSLHLLGKINNKLCAYLRLLPVNISYPNAISIGRVATATDMRGKGLGREAIKQTFHYLKNKNNTTPLIISAQLYLKAFYASFGFQAVGDVYDEDGIPHIEMHKDFA